LNGLTNSVTAFHEIGNHLVGYFSPEAPLTLVDNDDPILDCGSFIHEFVNPSKKGVDVCRGTSHKEITYKFYVLFPGFWTQAHKSLHHQRGRSTY
jgi:hypothetical protein